MSQINRELREQLLSKTKKRRYRVAMLNASQQKLREGIESTLHLKEHTKTLLHETKKCCPNNKCSRECGSTFMHELFPFIRIMRRYSIKRNLLQDVVAGLTVGIMHIPQGMAYGFLAQLPPIYGLYTSFFPVFLYFFFGSSRHISVGTFAVISLMVGQVVTKGYNSHVGHKILNADGTSNFTSLATGLLSNATTLMPIPQIEPLVQTDGYANPIKLGFALSLTFVVGVVQLLMGVTRLGFMASFMSDPFISGFTTGASIHVFSSQIEHVFGLHIKKYYGPLALIYFYADVFVNLRHTNMVTFTASVTCILVLVLIKEGVNSNKDCQPHLIMPVPIELVVIMISTIVSYYTKLGRDFDVSVVGKIPSGLPMPEVTYFRYIPEVLADGITIGFIAFAISYSMAKILADRHGYRVNANQELIANGVSNFVSSFFSSYVSAASLSRSLVQETAGGKTQEMFALGACNLMGSFFNALICTGSISNTLVLESLGGKTQVVGLVSSAVVLVVLLYVGPLFEALPECILASIVIVSLKGMFQQFSELKRLWKISKRDMSVWLVTFIAVVVFDVALGLLIGIVFSLYFVLRHSQKPEMSEMGQLPETGMYNDLRVTKQVTEVPGMKIFRFETSIYFANAEHFRDRLYKKTGLLPRKLLKRKRKAMHETLQRRKRELEEMELEKKRKAAQSPQRHYHIEVVTEAPVDPYEQQLKRAAENRLIMERFAAAWQPPIKVIIIDLSVVNYIDSVGVKTLSSIVTQYKEVGIKTFIAGSKPDVRTMLRTADFTKTIDYSSLYSTVHEAVVIGQEIVDEEIRKNIPPREDIKLMIEISNRDPNAPENDGNDQFEEEDDEEEDSDGKPAQPSILNLKDAHNDDDDDTWFDVSPYDFEMRTVQVHPETVGLLHREETAEVEGGAASISRRGKIVTFSSRGSLIHDEDFDNVPLSQDHTESSAL